MRRHRLLIYNTTNRYSNRNCVEFKRNQKHMILMSKQVTFVNVQLLSTVYCKLLTVNVDVDN